MLSGLTSLLIAAVISGVAMFREDTRALSDARKSSPHMSMFAFTGADNWRKGPSNKTSIALFNNADTGGESPCFASTEYYEGAIDVTVELQKNQQTLRNSGYEVTPFSTKTLAMRTPGGDRQYELHLSSVASPDGLHKVMGGNALGYLQLLDGYLKIYGNCNKAEELPRVFPALEAVRVADVS